jgi:hypothetical protein
MGEAVCFEVAQPLLKLLLLQLQGPACFTTLVRTLGITCYQQD